MRGEIPSFITLPYAQDFTPPDNQDACDQYPSSLVRYFLESYTKPKHKVFDPFMGFGTTALVAEDMGRIPYGVEADGERHEWGAGQLENWLNVICGDSADLTAFGFPKMDFCITSPPFMHSHEKWNPLYGGDPAHAGYNAYLARMGEIFTALHGIMKRNAKLIVHVDNLQHRRSFTPLVRDMSQVISKSFKPVAEIIVQWSDAAPADQTHTHCLVFQR